MQKKTILTSAQLLRQNLVTERGPKIEEQLQKARDLHRHMIYAVRIGEYDTWESLNEKYQEVLDGLWAVIGKTKPMHGAPATRQVTTAAKLLGVQYIRVYTNSRKDGSRRIKLFYTNGSAKLNADNAKALAQVFPDTKVSVLKNPTYGFMKQTFSLVVEFNGEGS